MSLIRGRWKWDSASQKMIPVREAKKEVNAPTYLSDEIPPTECMADGKIYTSKRKMSDAVRAHGFTETGGVRDVASAPREYDREKSIREDIERAYYQVKYGEAPLSEADRARCREMNRRLKRD